MGAGVGGAARTRPQPRRPAAARRAPPAPSLLDRPGTRPPDALRAASRHFLVWLSGARPELLKHSRTDRPAYTGLGAAILISGASPRLSASFALHTALYISWPLAALLGRPGARVSCPSTGGCVHDPPRRIPENPAHHLPPAGARPALRGSSSRFRCSCACSPRKSPPSSPMITRPAPSRSVHALATAPRHPDQQPAKPAQPGANTRTTSLPVGMPAIRRSAETRSATGPWHWLRHNTRPRPLTGTWTQLSQARGELTHWSRSPPTSSFTARRDSSSASTRWTRSPARAPSSRSPASW